MNTFRAGAILLLPVMIILAQNARDMIFEFGLDCKQVWV
jgi:hypothetical protein